MREQVISRVPYMLTLLQEAFRKVEAGPAEGATVALGPCLHMRHHEAALPRAQPGLAPGTKAGPFGRSTV